MKTILLTFPLAFMLAGCSERNTPNETLGSPEDRELNEANDAEAQPFRENRDHTDVDTTPMQHHEKTE